MKFEWDLNKAHINLQKHVVRFDEAKTVFDDPLACIFYDEWHSLKEERELIIGHSSGNRLLIVSFTELVSGTVRIVSARKTTAYERKAYEKHST